MTPEEHRAQAAEHVVKAEELIGKKAPHPSEAARGGAHATLALYHQREADRLEAQ
jgi:hypothetical protein